MHCLDYSFGFKDFLFVVFFVGGVVFKFRTHFLLEIELSPRRGRVLLINPEVNSKGLGLWGLVGFRLWSCRCEVPSHVITPPPPPQPPPHPEPQKLWLLARPLRGAVSIN